MQCADFIENHGAIAPVERHRLVQKSRCVARNLQLHRRESDAAMSNSGGAAVMPRRNITDAHVARWIKQGKGQGQGNGYIPWFKVRDVPSCGEGWQTPLMYYRERSTPHQYLSRLEKSTGCILEWLGAVEIREQYADLSPHRDRDETIEIAERLGVRHPVYRDTKTPIVVTTDIVATMPKGELQAAYCKPKALLDPATEEGRRNIKKKAIEACYWDARGIELKVVTEDTYPELLKKNVIDLRDRMFFHEHDHVVPRITEAVECFMGKWTRSTILADLIEYLPPQTGLTIQQSANLIYRATWQGLIPVKLAAGRFHPRLPVVLA